MPSKPRRPFVQCAIPDINLSLTLPYDLIKKLQLERTKSALYLIQMLRTFFGHLHNPLAHTNIFKRYKFKKNKKKKHHFLKCITHTFTMSQHHEENIKG